MERCFIVHHTRLKLLSYLEKLSNSANHKLRNSNISKKRNTQNFYILGNGLRHKVLDNRLKIVPVMIYFDCRYKKK